MSEALRIYREVVGEPGGSSSVGREGLERTVPVRLMVRFADANKTSIDAEDAYVLGTVQDGDYDRVPAHGEVLGWYDLVVRSKSASRKPDDPFVWIVDITYKTPDPRKDDPPEYGKRWNFAVSGSGVRVEEEVSSYPDQRETDPEANYLQVKNSADDLIDPPPKRPYSWASLVVEYDTDVPDWDAMEAAKDCCNDGEITLLLNSPGWWRPSVKYPLGAVVATKYSWDTQNWNVRIWKSMLVENQGWDPTDPGQTAWALQTDYPGYRKYATGKMLLDDYSYRYVLDVNQVRNTRVTLNFLTYKPSPDSNTWDTLRLVDRGWKAKDNAGKPFRIGVNNTMAGPKGEAAKTVQTCLDGTGKILAVGQKVVRVSFPGWRKKVSFAALLAGLVKNT